MLVAEFSCGRKKKYPDNEILKTGLIFWLLHNPVTIQSSLLTTDPSHCVENYLSIFQKILMPQRCNILPAVVWVGWVGIEQCAPDGITTILKSSHTGRLVLRVLILKWKWRPGAKPCRGQDSRGSLTVVLHSVSSSPLGDRIPWLALTEYFQLMMENE